MAHRLAHRDRATERPSPPRPPLLCVGFSQISNFPRCSRARHTACTGKDMKWRAGRGSALLSTWAIGALSSLGVACGGTQNDPASSGGGAAGAAGSGGSSGSSANGGVAGHGVGGTGGSAGTTQAGAGGGSGAPAAGAGGAAQSPVCPGTAPLAASACAAAGQRCFYEDCAGAGRSDASCDNGSWTVHTAACGAVHCTGFASGTSCATGQVCSIIEGGAISTMCAQSSCGSGPVTCACAHASCTNCAITGSPEQGFTVTCVANCPAATCA